MLVYPPSADEKLSFDVLHARLESYLLSPVGRDLLAAQKPSSDAGWIRAELSRVSALQQVFRFDDPAPLYPVRDVRKGLSALAPAGSAAEVDVLLDLRRVLEALRRAGEYFRQRKEQYPQLFEVTREMISLPELEKRIGQIVDDDGRILDSASSELKRLRRKLVSTQSRLRETLLAELNKSMGQGYTTEAQPTMRSGRMVIPVRAEAKRKVNGFVHDVSSTGQTVYIEPAACLELNNEVRSIEAEEHHEVRRILIEIADRVREHVPAIRLALNQFGVLDLLQAKARLSNQLEAYCTRVNEEGRIDLRQGRNPILQLLLPAADPSTGKKEGTDRSVVPLDLKLGGEAATLILTGPNAGGKTVAMKTLGLFSLMLAHGLPLPADELSEFALFSRLIVDIGDEQSIENDLSTFSSHVANLRYMTENAGPDTLILIDEAGTGTDPAEGAALAQTVLQRLTDAGARTVATTHHGALKVFAHDTPGIENGSMQFDRETLRPTYRLQQGIPGSSYAFEIASRMGLDPSILDEARALLGDESARLEDLIGVLESRNQSLTQRLEQVEKALAEADQERSRYRELFEKLDEERDAIKEKALLEAEEVMQKANAQIERTIREIKESQAAKEATREARTQLESFKQNLKKEKQKTSKKQQRRSRRKAGGKREQAPRMEGLEVGDQVILDGGSSTAELIEIDGNDAVIMAGSMHMRVKVGRLTKVGGPRRQKVTVNQVKAARSGGGLSALQARQRIDLRGQRVDEALSKVVRLIDDALATSLSRVEIVHGKGTGALRQAVHEYLEGNPDVSRYEDAPWEEGGPGVTYAYL